MGKDIWLKKEGRSSAYVVHLGKVELYFSYEMLVGFYHKGDFFILQSALSISSTTSRHISTTFGLTGLPDSCYLSDEEFRDQVWRSLNIGEKEINGVS